MKSVIAIALFAMFAWTSPAAETFDKLLGTRPPEWRLTNWINSTPLKLADLRGKVVLVRWWTAPQCPYCRATAPALNEFHEGFAARGLSVVGVYHHKAPTRLDAKKVARQAADFGFKFPVAIDPDWRTLERWWLDGNERGWTSVTFLLDREGVIRHIHPGGQYVRGDEAYAAMKAKIEELLREPTPAK